MIKNIIFDIGNVLAEFRWRDCIAEAGITGEKAERVGRATVLGKWWTELDRGMNLQEVIEECVKLDPEVENEIRLFFKDRTRLVLEYDYSEGWMKEMKERGYNVYILSNYSEDHFNYILNHFKFFGIEDGMVISYREHLLKPDAAIYNLLMERYNLIPEECVFLDDNKDNIEGAKAVGIHGIVFNNYIQGKSELEELLKTID